MRLHELARTLDLVELTPPVPAAPSAGGGTDAAQTTADTDPVIKQGYASDLLSDVLANAPTGSVLITLQVHMNVIAVAGHANLAAVIFPSGREPEDDVIERATAEGVALFSSTDDTFGLVGRLYSLGIRGVGV